MLKYHQTYSLPLRVQKGGLHHLSKLLNLFLATSNITVGHIWLLFNLNTFHDDLDLCDVISADLHHGDSWVNLGRERDVDLVLVPVYPDPHALLNISGGNRVSQINNKLSKLLDIDNVPD